MMQNFVNSLETFPFRIQVFHDQETPEIPEDRLRSLLDPAVARKYNLDVETFNRTVSQIVSNTDGQDRVSVILLGKESGIPVALSTFLRRSFDDVEKIIPLPGAIDAQELRGPLRKVFYELQYCFRSSHVRGKCTGDVMMACGLEALNSIIRKRPCVITVWLLLAGSFSNLDALNLYTRYRFGIVGLYEGTAVLSLCDVEKHIAKVDSLMRRNLEATFLLPHLKERHLQLEESDERLPVDDEDSASQESETSTPPSSTVSISVSPSVPVSRRPLRHENTAQSPLMQQLVKLKFRKFSEHMKCCSDILLTVSDVNPECMKQNLFLMARRVVAMEESFSFYQHLEMAKQLEVYGRSLDLNTYDAATAIRNDINGLDYTLSYLRKIVRISWCVYRYPVLEQAKLPWREGINDIPKLAELMDTLIADQRGLPDNVLQAQKNRYGVYLRLTISFPELEVGDGDGLPEITLLKINGMFVNEIAVEDEVLLRHSNFKNIITAVGQRFRCRLAGYDTQEKPCLEDGNLDTVPQHFWREGRDALREELLNLRNGLRPRDAIIVCDCFGIDIFQRLLIDIRGVNHRGSIEDTEELSLSRFEIARRLLVNGVAHPTYESFTNTMLLEAFVSARENRRGAFADDREFIHPSLCRKRRYEMKRDKRRQRTRYNE